MLWAFKETHIVILLIFLYKVFVFSGYYETLSKNRRIQILVHDDTIVSKTILLRAELPMKIILNKYKKVADFCYELFRIAKIPLKFLYITANFQINFFQIISTFFCLFISNLENLLMKI